jgi:protein SCO1/2
MAMTRRKWLTTMGSGTLVAGVGAIAARGFGALGGSPHQFQAVPAAGAGSARAVLQQRHLLNLPLVTQDGRAVKFYDDLVKDKKVVLTFMNTDPAALASSKKVSQNLWELQKFFGSRMGKDIHFYTITANPSATRPRCSRTGPPGTAMAPAGPS